MKAVVVYIARILIVLAALPLGVIVAQLPFGNGSTAGEAELAVFPFMLIAVCVFVVIALLINTFYLKSVEPQPYWLRSHLVRVGIAALVTLVFISVLALAY
jgi:hypothetical protein